MNEKEKALAGMWFTRGSLELKVERDRAQNLCFQLNQLPPFEEEKRDEIIRSMITDIKGSYHINSPFYCDYGSHIHLGNNFFANYNCTMIDGGEITFGDTVSIGPNCCFVTPNHATDPTMRLENKQIYKPITVGNNVWFGANCVICPGVTIGDNCVIAAGSVVVKDIPANTLAAGNPCKVKRQLDTQNQEKPV